MLGRERECEMLDRLLDGVRGGHGGVLVVHGEAGVGKTALLEYAAETGRGFRIAATSGVEAEMELPFAAVAQLCSPFFEFTEHLPQPQHDALGVAFGLSTGPAPNPFLVGLAVLGLLAEAAEEQPLACVVDDAQWLDSASARTFAFVGRRLLAEKIAHELFRDFGVEAFAERARLELQATGERARKRTVDTRDQLTAQETQIARLAAEGHTNREIAVRLFISASTVEYHLHEAFRKLDVKSRTQLEGRLT